MASKDWSIEGRWAEYCSCDLGCPCESMAEPTRTYCTGVVGFIIDKGHVEGVRLDGLKVAATFYFPRAIHHGEGHMQPFISSGATEDQRNAIFYILSGEDQAIGTMFQIFSVIIAHLHDPQFADLDFEIDVEARKAHLRVDGSLDVRSEPIRNPVTNEEHRIITTLPDGWVFHEAEGAAGFAKSTGDLKFDLNRNHSSLAYISWGPNGLKHTLAEARELHPLA